MPIWEKISISSRKYMKKDENKIHTLQNRGKTAPVLPSNLIEITTFNVVVLVTQKLKQSKNPQK